MSNYHQDTVSLDSASVSSQSEMSENLLTVSGERCLLSVGEDRCYLSEDSGVDQLFSGRSNGVTRHNGDTDIEATLLSPESVESSSIGTSLGTGSSQPLVHVFDEDDYDHLEEADVLLYMQNGVAPAHRSNRLASVDFERIPEVDDRHLTCSMITGRDLWKNSIVQLESDSDSESTSKEAPSAKFTVGSVDREENFTRSLPESVYSTLQVGSKEKPVKPDDSNYYNFATLASDLPYANVFIPGPGGNAYGQSSAPVKRLRPRSKSSSPYNKKKPVPLPRRVTNGQIGEQTASEKITFVESLPANFKPQPPPKPTSLAGLGSNVSKHPIRP